METIYFSKFIAGELHVGTTRTLEGFLPDLTSY